MTSSPLKLSTCVVHLDGRRVDRGDDTLYLSHQEASLLAHLASQAGNAVEREVLFREVLGYTSGANSRALDAAIRRLRQKIEADPSKPTHLLTVYGVGYRLRTSDPAPTRAGLGSFPQWTDAFMGRDELVRTVLEELEEHPLLTLQGPGGVGKTRLACEVLTSWCEANAGATIHLVTVHPTANDAAIASAVVRALALEAREDPSHTVEVALQAQPRALVLDGAEVAVPAVARLVSQWIANIEHSRIVVTSRERLATARERVLWIPPLERTAAAALLRERATAARGGRPWTEHDDPELLQIVARLDGLPLALELAASRAPVFTADQLRLRLADSFEILKRTTPIGPTHHSALQAAVAWSWDLLDARERAVLLRLSILEGPFPIETAEALVDAEQTLQIVSDLVAKSLLQPIDGHGRLRMLDTIRAFVRSQAATSPEADTAALERLAAIAHRVPLAPVDRLEGATRALDSGLHTAVHAVLAALQDCPDARQAIVLAEQGRMLLEGEERTRIAIAAVPALIRVGTAMDIERWLRVLLRLDPEDSQLQADLHFAIGRLLQSDRRSDAEAIQHLTRAAELSEGPSRLPILSQLARALLGMDALHDARQVCEHALQLAVHGTLWHARAQAILGSLVLFQEFDLERSNALLLQSASTLRALGNDWAHAATLTHLVELREFEGRLVDAIELAGQCAAMAAHMGCSRTLMHARLQACRPCLTLGRWEEGIERGKQAIRLGERTRHLEVVCKARIVLAEIHSHRTGRHLEALEALQEVLDEANGIVTPGLVAEIHMVRVRVAWQADDTRSVREIVSEMMTSTPHDDPPLHLARTHTTRALALARYDPTQAAESLERAAAHMAELHSDSPMLRAEWHLAAGAIGHHTGEQSDARRHVSRAQILLSELKLGPDSPLGRRMQALRQALD